MQEAQESQATSKQFDDKGLPCAGRWRTGPILCRELDMVTLWEGRETEVRHNVYSAGAASLRYVSKTLLRVLVCFSVVVVKHCDQTQT